MKKLLWVKFGWSEFYRGGPVDGNFGWLNKQRGKKSEGRGHEAFNFMPNPDGTYRCYVPPQAGGHAPWNAHNAGWTVVCLAKNPRHPGIYVVGWYENATLIGDWRDANTRDQGSPYDWSYCITSKSAHFIPPDRRREPFSHPSVRQGKYSFLSGPDVADGENKRRIRALLESRLADLKGVAVHNPSDKNAPDPEINPGDPLAGFGTPEHRKSVEIAAERAVVEHYRRRDFAEKRVAHLNCGYDFVFTKSNSVLHVEVKGTSSVREQFFMTRNEYKYHVDPRWRLAIVTNALGKDANVKIYDNREFKAAFDLEPYVYLGREIDEPKSV